MADISDQSGEQEIWITDADGTRTQITRLEGRRMGQPHWSPDGKVLLFTVGPEWGRIFTVPAAGGKATRVLGDANDASWSHDGKSIYYSSRMAPFGEPRRTAPSAADRSRRGGGDAHESADGKYVYYRSRRSIWRARGGRRTRRGVRPGARPDVGRHSGHPKGVFYLEFARNGRSLVVEFYDFATKKSQPVVRFKNTNWFDGYSISPDGKYVLYSKVDQNETNLIMVENFR